MGVTYIVVTLNSKVIERRKLDKELTTIGRAQENDFQKKVSILGLFNNNSYINNKSLKGTLSKI